MFLKEWVEGLRERDLSEATVNAYHSDLGSCRSQ
jgi:hypothetical protein